MGVLFEYKSESENLDNLSYLTDRGGAVLLRNSFHQESKIYRTEAQTDHQMKR